MDTQDGTGTIVRSAVSPLPKRRLVPRRKETQMNKLPTWNNRNLNENSTPITDKELADKIKLHHSSCQEAIKMIESFLNENK